MIFDRFGLRCSDFIVYFQCLFGIICYGKKRELNFYPNSLPDFLYTLSHDAGLAKDHIVESRECVTVCDR